MSGQFVIPDVLPLVRLVIANRPDLTVQAAYALVFEFIRFFRLKQTLNDYHTGIPKLAPSPQVDYVWRLFIEDTVAYAQACGHAERFIHRVPIKDAASSKRLLENTRTAYQAEYNEDAPEEVVVLAPATPHTEVKCGGCEMMRVNFDESGYCRWCYVTDVVDPMMASISSREKTARAIVQDEKLAGVRPSHICKNFTDYMAIAEDLYVACERLEKLDLKNLSEFERLYARADKLLPTADAKRLKRALVYEKFDVEVKTLAGENIMSSNFSRDMSVAKFYRHIAGLVNIPADTFYIIVGGVQLDMGKILTDYEAFATDNNYIAMQLISR